MRLVVPLLVVAAVAGCGGAEPAGPGSATPPTATAPRAAPPADPLATPRDVPGRATGPASADAQRTVRRWLAALSRGDVEGAARVWALPARFQNGTPVLRIDTPAERLAMNASLPCGGRVAEIGGAGRFTVVTIRLTPRPGADCGAGAGGVVRSAVLVQGGRLRALFRLDEPGERPAAPSGPVTPV